MAEGPEEVSLARAILQLSHTFQLDAVAEGIETEEQRDALALRGCLHGQGFLFAPPLPPGELLAHLEREHRGEGAPPHEDAPARADREGRETRERPTRDRAHACRTTDPEHSESRYATAVAAGTDPTG
jgi:hypothetical protein